MAGIDIPNKACPDCLALVVGKLQDPHQYLMASARSAQSLGYRCLICDANLVCELKDWTPRWSAHGENPQRSMRK